MVGSRGVLTRTSSLNGSRSAVRCSQDGRGHAQAPDRGTSELHAILDKAKVPQTPLTSSSTTVLSLPTGSARSDLAQTPRPCS